MRIGIFGATGNVGIEVLKLLEIWNTNEWDWDCEPILFGTERSAGKQIKFKGKSITVTHTEPENIEGIDLIISAANGTVSERFVPIALKQGTKLVIDTDSYYRMNGDVPLVTAGVNDHDIDWHKGIIAGPNCTTAQLILPLNALYRGFGLERVVVSTYQAVSGAGKETMDKMVKDSHEILKSNEIRRVNDSQIAFNVIPMISKLMENGYSKEENKVMVETRKMLGDQSIKMTCTAVRVPVMSGHSESVNVELKRSFSLEDVHSALKEQPFLHLWEDWSQFPMPIDVVGTEPVHVGRVRIDQSRPNTLDMWVVADNLWIGAALNAIRVAESAILRGKVR